MFSRSGPRNQQDVRRQVQQPSKGKLGRRRAQPPSELSDGPTAEDSVLSPAWPTEWEEWHEPDASRCALVQHVTRALIGEIEQVRHANDLGLGDRPEQMR